VKSRCADATTEQQISSRSSRRAEATGDPLAYAPGYNIAPTTTQPVVRLARDTNLSEIVPMRWGLVGFGSAGIDPKRSTFNARAEGLENSSLWKRPLHRQRCLVPVSGYYEWVRPEVVPMIVRRGHTTGPAVPSAVP